MNNLDLKNAINSLSDQPAGIKVGVNIYQDLHAAGDIVQGSFNPVGAPHVVVKFPVIINTQVVVWLDPTLPPHGVAFP